MSGTPIYYSVPAGSRASECRGEGCHAPIHWIVDGVKKDGSPKRVPVDCDGNDECHEPTATEDGLGVSHFLTCANANRFSGSTRGAR